MKKEARNLIPISIFILLGGFSISATLLFNSNALFMIFSVISVLGIMFFIPIGFSLALYLSKLTRIENNKKGVAYSKGLMIMSILALILAVLSIFIVWHYTNQIELYNDTASLDDYKQPILPLLILNASLLGYVLLTGIVVPLIDIHYLKKKNKKLNAKDIWVMFGTMLVFSLGFIGVKIVATIVLGIYGMLIMW